jgi:hypothetical protein
VGRFPRVVRSSQPQANFRSAFSVLEFAAIREIRVKKFSRGSSGSRLKQKRPPFPKAALLLLKFDFTDAGSRAAAWAGSGWRGSRWCPR